MTIHQTIRMLAACAIVALLFAPSAGIAADKSKKRRVQQKLRVSVGTYG